jgi:hypothetical protein
VSGPGFDQWGYNQQVVTLSIAVYRGRPGGGGEAGGAEGGEVAGVLAAEWLATDWEIATLGSVDECTTSSAWCFLVDQVNFETTCPCRADSSEKQTSAVKKYLATCHCRARCDCTVLTVLFCRREG